MGRQIKLHFRYLASFKRLSAFFEKILLFENQFAFRPLNLKSYLGAYSAGPNKQGGQNKERGSLNILFTSSGSWFQHLFYKCSKYVEIDIFVVFLGVSETKIAWKNKIYDQITYFGKFRITTSNLILIPCLFGSPFIFPGISSTPRLLRPPFIRAFRVRQIIFYIHHNFFIVFGKH